MSSEEFSLIQFVKELLPMLGVIIGASIPLIKDWLSGRRAEKLERIKLHDSNKISAYQNVYKFSSTLRMSLEDNTQAKDLAFFNACAGQLSLVVENLPYYSPKVRNILIELEEVVESISNDILNVDTNSKMVSEKVSPISIKLKKEIINDFNVWE